MSRHIVDIEAEASEATRDDGPPPGVTPTRPGRGTVLSVRLAQDEVDALTTLAKQRSVPVSTLARSLIVESLNSGDDAGEGAVHDAVVRALRETLSPDLLASASTPMTAPAARLY